MTMARWVVAAVVAGSLLASASGAQEKIAVVDAARALKEFKKTKEADQRMEERVAEFNAEGDRLLADYEKMKKEFEGLRAETQNKALSEKAVAEKKDQAEEKLLQMVEFENKMRETAMSRRKQLEEQRMRMHKRLVEEISKEVERYAIKQGYTLVLDASGLTTSGFNAVLFSGTRMDITDEVVEILNAATTATNESKPAAAQ